MLKFSLAGERAQAGVFARGCPPDAGYLRTATAGLGEPESGARPRGFLFQRSDWPPDADPAARKPFLNTEHRAGCCFSKEEVCGHRRSSVRNEVCPRRPA